jgi:molybdate-binding protein
MPELGLVSRVSPVQAALRNYTRDDGRTFEVGNQVLISSHRKLLASKAMVVNVAEKSGTRFRQV